MELSTDLKAIVEYAQKLAQESNSRLQSKHLLQALAEVPTSCKNLLAQRGISSGKIKDLMDETEDEPQPLVEKVLEKVHQLATSFGASQGNPLHLLIVLSQKHTAANATTLLNKLIRNDLHQFRNVIVSEITRKDPALGNIAPHLTHPATGATTESLTLPESESAEKSQYIAAEEPIIRMESAQISLFEEAILAPDPVSPTPTEFSLAPDQFPWLCLLARNISELAVSGKLDPLIGRKNELNQMVDILNKRRSNNPLLLGKPGVGKTAIVEGLAQMMIDPNLHIQGVSHKTLVEINMGNLLAGTQLRGSFSEKLKGIQQEVKKGDGQIIVFIDEIHTLIGAGITSDGGALDAANELKSSLARGEFPCIGATTEEEYKKYIEKDAALERRFVPLFIEEPGEAEAIEIIQGLLPRYAQFHQVTYTEESIEAAVKLSKRYIHERYLPDKAVNLIDLAGARARRNQKLRVDRNDIARIVTDLTAVPLEQLTMSDNERFADMERIIGQKLIGQKEGLQAVCNIIKRNYAGFSGKKPIGSFLFLGPTGVGKTELAKVLAEFLFHQRESLLRFDMSEYKEEHAISKFLGAPPGYVGHGEGGQLTESVRKKPYQLILLDEIEKAHPHVLQILLQLLDEGRLTDSKGRTVDFTQTVIIMTSNLGSEHYFEKQSRIGFEKASETTNRQDLFQKVIAAAKSQIPAELWNRIDEKIVFSHLLKPEILEIARLLIDRSREKLKKEKGIEFEVSEGAIEYLIENGGYDKKYGARPMLQTIQRLMEVPIATEIISGKIQKGDLIRIKKSGEKLVVEKYLTHS